MENAHVLAVCIALLAASSALAQAPYAGQESRAIKALSAEDIEGYRAGKGMGLAKAAELNGYPGPSHVLEMAVKLRLTEEQRTRTEALFRSMQVKASAAGRELVEAEARLDRLFASRAATPEATGRALEEIGALQAKVRGAHLEAHLDQVKILEPAQVVEYNRLRGYDSPTTHGQHHKHH